MGAVTPGAQRSQLLTWPGVQTQTLTSCGSLSLSGLIVLPGEKRVPAPSSSPCPSGLLSADGKGGWEACSRVGEGHDDEVPVGSCAPAQHVIGLVTAGPSPASALGTLTAPLHRPGTEGPERASETCLWSLSYEAAGPGVEPCPAGFRVSSLIYFFIYLKTLLKRS